MSKQIQQGFPSKIADVRFSGRFFGVPHGNTPNRQKRGPSTTRVVFHRGFEGRKVGVVLLKYLSANIQRAYL